MFHRLLPALAVLALLLPGCDSALDCSEDTSCVEPAATVFVGNQGNFTDQTGSITVYDATTQTTTQDGYGIGTALVQHLILDRSADERLFALLNFSDSFSTGRGRIDVVDLNTGTVTANIDVNTPRSAFRDAGTLWVTNLYAGTVTPIDLSTNMAGTPVAVGMNPEGLTIAQRGLFVANNGFGFETTVTIVDPINRTVLETLDIGCDGPKVAETDTEGEVWVFCSGKTVFDPDTFEIVEQTNGTVVVLNGSTGVEVARFDLPGQLGAGVLGQDAILVPVRREAWAIVGDQIIRFDTAANTQGETLTPQIPSGAVLGAIAYDTDDDRLYLAAAAGDFVSAGSVVITDRNGMQVGSFPAGIAPASLVIQDAD